MYFPTRGFKMKPDNATNQNNNIVIQKRRKIKIKNKWFFFTENTEWTVKMELVHKSGREKSEFGTRVAAMTYGLLTEEARPLEKVLEKLTI